MWSVHAFPWLQIGLFMATAFFRNYPPAGTWLWLSPPLCSLQKNLCSGTWDTAFFTDHGFCMQPFLSWSSWLSPWQEPQEQGPSWEQVPVYTCVFVFNSLLAFSSSLNGAENLQKETQHKTHKVTCALAQDWIFTEHL